MNVPFNRQRGELPRQQGQIMEGEPPKSKFLITK